MKKLLLSLIIIFNSVISALSMNYDKEWKRVDDLMDRVKLKDAQTLVEKIKNVAEKEVIIASFCMRKYIRMLSIWDVNIH